MNFRSGEKKKDLRGCYIHRRSPFNRIIQGREEARLNSRRELFTLSHRTVRFKIFFFRVFFFLFIIGSMTKRKIHRHPRNGFSSMFQSNYNTVAFQYFKLNDERIFRRDREYEYEFHLGQVDIGELMERWMLVDG